MPYDKGELAKAFKGKDDVNIILEDIEEKYFEKEDIKSAVEFLKKEFSIVIDNIKINGDKSGRLSCLNSAYVETIKKIDEAFEDVVK